MKATLPFKIRFSEIDAMHVVWHGAYAKYLEDAREHFGQVYQQNLTAGKGVDLVAGPEQIKKPVRVFCQIHEQIFIFVIRIEFIICHIEIKISGYTVIECIKILVVSLKRDSKSVRCGFNGYHSCHPFFRCPAEWK